MAPRRGRRVRVLCASACVLLLSHHNNAPLEVSRRVVGSQGKWFPRMKNYLSGRPSGVERARPPFRAFRRRCILVQCRPSCNGKGSRPRLRGWKASRRSGPARFLGPARWMGKMGTRIVPKSFNFENFGSFCLSCSQNQKQTAARYRRAQETAKGGGVEVAEGAAASNEGWNRGGGCSELFCWGRRCGPAQ